MRTLATAAVTLLFSAIALGGGKPGDLSCERGIRSGLERSPEHYIAGIFEPYGGVKCEDSCWVTAKPVEVFAWRGPTESVPKEIRLSNAGPASIASGGTTMGFLVPVGSTEPQAFTGTFLTVRLSEEDIDQFRRTVERVLEE